MIPHDSRLEIEERRVWDAERRRADRVARGSRAGTATAAGQSVAGVVLAETTIRYGSTYSVTDGVTIQVLPLGYGFGGYDGGFAYS